MDILSTKDTYRCKYGEIPKLTTTNYFAWTKAMHYILLAANAWNIMNGEELPPDPPAANASTHTCERYKDKFDDYNSRCNIAAATIYQSCSATIQAFLKDYPTPTDMWQILKDPLDKASNKNGLILLR